MALIDQIIGVESGGNANARNPRSTATGAGQFIERTWLDMIARNRPDLMQGRTREQILALRTDPALSREMTQAYANQNSQALSAAGLPVTPGTTYLSHFAGPQGAISVLKADPSAPVGSVLGDAAMRANPHLRGMTVADLRAWADRKMTGNGPAVTQGSPSVSPQAGAASPTGMLSKAMGGLAINDQPGMESLGMLGQFGGPVGNVGMLQQAMGLMRPPDTPTHQSMIQHAARPQRRAFV